MMATRVVSGPDGVAAAVALLRAGEPVALPTETVYGLGAAALDPLACAKVFEAKARPLDDPLIVHLPDATWLDRLTMVGELPRALARAFWPGPLTLVLPAQPVVPAIVTAGQRTVAVRMSAHPVFREVAEEFGQPIAAPSANRFGRISPTMAAHVVTELGGRIPLVLDGGSCAHGIESTIVQVCDDTLRILRHGPVTREELARFGSLAARDGGPAAPGGMASHYAPRTPLDILPAGSEPTGRAGEGLLAWTRGGEGFDRTEILSPTGDLREAAARLFGAMRRLDEAGLDRIVAESVPDTGLGAAIMERLRKAAAR